jgi:hypothetical protein
MEKTLLTKWPWMVAAFLFIGVGLLALGTWYGSAWFVVVVALMAMSLARAKQPRPVEARLYGPTGTRPPAE